MIELGDVGDDGPPVQQPHVHHVGGVKQRGDVQLSLGQAEGCLTVAEGAVDVQTVELDEVRPEPGDDGTEGEARPPGVGEVRDVDPGVAGGHLAAPLLEGRDSRVKHDREEREERGVSSVMVTARLITGPCWTVSGH